MFFQINNVHFSAYIIYLILYFKKLLECTERVPENDCTEKHCVRKITLFHSNCGTDSNLHEI